MPANTSPIFILTPNLGTVRITGSNTTSDGSGTLFQLLTGSINGTRVDAVRFRNSANAVTGSSATLHRIYYTSTPATGSATRLVGEVATAAGATRSTTQIGATSIYTFDIPLFMVSGSVLSVGQSTYGGVQDQFDAQAFAGDY